MKYFQPDFFFESMEKIDFGKLKQKNVKAIILDIDNTLVEPHTPVADGRAKKFVNELKDCGFKICIVSNNIYERAEKFSNSLELPFICDGDKPSRKPLSAALAILNEKAENTAIIGDQIFTDVWGAKRMNMVSVLVKPICNKENKFIKFKRLLEKAVVKLD